MANDEVAELPETQQECDDTDTASRVDYDAILTEFFGDNYKFLTDRQKVTARRICMQFENDMCTYKYRYHPVRYFRRGVSRRGMSRLLNIGVIEFATASKPLSSAWVKLPDGLIDLIDSERAKVGW